MECPTPLVCIHTFPKYFRHSVRRLRRPAEAPLGICFALVAMLPRVAEVLLLERGRWPLPLVAGATQVSADAAASANRFRTPASAKGTPAVKLKPQRRKVRRRYSVELVFISCGTKASLVSLVYCREGVGSGPSLLLAGIQSHKDQHFR